MHIRVLTRKVHRWGSIVVAIPLLVVIVSGILLQLKKESSWIQPPTAKGAGKTPQISFDAILAATASIAEAEVQSWGDIDRLDVQPSKGIVKVQCKNRWEVQIDLKTGDILQKAYRRSDLIESFHDGSWFHDSAKLWVFLPAAAILLVLWLTGIYLFFLPIVARWSKRRRAASPQ
jgi:uncharacterized iron-regulated membrane protein